MSAPKHGDRDLAVTRLGGLLKIFERQANVDSTLADLSVRAAEFGTIEEAREALEWTEQERKERGFDDKRQLNVAVHASLPFQHMPAYLRMAHERSMGRMKILPTGEGGAGAKLVVIPTAPGGELGPVEDDDE